MNRIPVSFTLIVNFLLFIFPFDIVSGQEDSTVLSFEERLEKIVADDHSKLKIHYEYGESLDETKRFPQAIIQFKNALRISQELNNNKMIAQTANYLANMFAVKGDFKNSDETYILALASAEKNGNPGEIAKKNMNLATNNYFTGNCNKAIPRGLPAMKTQETSTLQTILLSIQTSNSR